MSFTDEVAAFVADSRFSDIHPETIKSVKAIALDYFACALAGSGAPGVQETAGVARDHGGGGRATVLVLGGKAVPMWAAMVNSIMGHAFDFDDTYDPAVLHTSTVVVPAALGLAESIGASGEEFLHAVTLGMEVHCRLGLAATVQPSDLGWIYTPLMGVFGSAAACSKLLRLDREKTLDALGLAYSLASGNHQALNEGTLAKRAQPGFASANGVLSALLSKAGLTGPHQPFEGTFGLFNVYLRGNVNPSRALAGLGKEFRVADVSLKPYPCCRHTHTAIDCMVEAHGSGVRAEDVREVGLEVNLAAFHAVCEPTELKYSPRTIVDAQFSLPYTAACALKQGWVYLDDFDLKAIGRSDILELASKVKVSVDSSLEENERRNISPAKASITLLDGRVRKFEAKAPKGSPAKAMSDEEVRVKFSDCVRHSAGPFDDGVFGDLAARVDRLEKLGSVGDLTRILTPSLKGAPRSR